MNQQLIDRAYKVILENDKGSYTVPTKGLYPFQWNWDSCLSALAIAYFDEARAWREITSLFEHQWEDGMVPHIVFHEPDEGYFPGPEVWQTKRPTPTSGITQPPVAGHVIRLLLERGKDKELALQEARSLVPKVLAWHEWFYRCRDPQATGLAAVLHPWETGRDNSVDWDAPFEIVPTHGVESYQRRDTDHAKPEHRPTKNQYDRYIYLIQKFRSLNWDNAKLHDASLFCVVDPGFNAILIRSSKDMLEVAKAIGDSQTAARFGELAMLGEAALEGLWSSSMGQYLCFDRAAGRFIENSSVGGLMPILTTASHAREISSRLRSFREKCKYLVPSQDPQSPEFDGHRYWRGPAWLIINYLIKTGLEDCGEQEIANWILQDSLELIHKSGFAEYYHPITAQACGGGDFTWTAAMVIEFLYSSSGCS